MHSTPAPAKRPGKPKLNPARVTELRLERGLLQRELAARAGISVQMMCDIEAGRRSGSPATRRQLAKALRVPQAELYVEAGR